LCFTWRNAAQNVYVHACALHSDADQIVDIRLCFTWRIAAQNVYVHACALHSDADQIVEVTFVLSMAQCCLKC
jgi:glutaminase